VAPYQNDSKDQRVIKLDRSLHVNYTSDPYSTSARLDNLLWPAKKCIRSGLRKGQSAFDRSPRSWPRRARSPWVREPRRGDRIEGWPCPAGILRTRARRRRRYEL